MKDEKESDNRFIELVPIGNIDRDILTYIVAIIEGKFTLPVKTGRALRTPPASFDPMRNQFNASMLLEELSRSISSNSIKALGVIDKDIFAKGLNYVFGQARLGGCCAVISLTRLRQGNRRQGGKNLFRERIEKEAIHELGHTFGLSHCSNPRCVMFFSNDIADTDRKGADFCPECGIPMYAKGITS